MASRTFSAEGWTYRIDWEIELWPAIRARVHTSQPDAPKRVRNVCLALYKTNGLTLLTRRAFLCCFLKVDGSTCPLIVSAGHIQPSSGLLAASHWRSRMTRTRGVSGRTRTCDLLLVRQAL